MHRKDDQPEVIQKRLKTYIKQTMPLIEYYKKQNIFVPVEAIGSPEDIFVRIYRILKEQ